MNVHNKLKAKTFVPDKPFEPSLMFVDLPLNPNFIKLFKAVVTYECP
jgi:hypothetical protein